MINNKIKIFADGADYKSILNFNMILVHKFFCMLK